MGVRISWDGRPTDMSDSKQSLISAMEEYIKRNSDSFINDFALAEERFEDDDSKYPIEDLDKMEEKFQDFFKEIKKRDLASFIRSLPKNKTWGDFKEIMGKSEILEGKTVGDLLDPSFRNILVGRGAFEYGREMEGIPPFNFFDSDLGEPSLKFDLVIKQTKGKKGNQFMIAPASGGKNDADIILKYPKQQGLGAIRDIKEEHLAKHGIFKTKFLNSPKAKYETIEEGDLVLKLPESLFGKFIENNTLLRQAKIRKVKLLSKTSLRGLEKLREPTNEERVEILQTLVDMNKNPRRNMMENIIEIDGETYEVRYGPASKYNITSSVRKEINELISANEDKFKTALRPILDNPKLIAEAIIEMNVVTSVKATEAQKTITTYDGPIDEKQLKKDTEKYLEKIQDTILAFKEYLEEDKTTLKEINEVYSKDYEQFREKRQDFIRQKNALEDPQGSEAKLLTQSIENANREMKEMLSDKKTVKDRISNYEERLKLYQEHFNTINDALNQNDFETLEPIIYDVGGPFKEITFTDKKTSGRNTAKYAIDFQEIWNEGFPVIYQIKAKVLGSFDLNPFKYSRDSGKSFNVGTQKAVNKLVTRMNDIKDTIEG